MNDSKIHDIDILRIKRGTGKVCRCFGDPSLTVDPDCRKVYCDDCGAEVDAFDAIHRMARNPDRYNRRMKYLSEQIAEAERTNLRSNLFRNLQNRYLFGRKMVPYCPVCNHPFEFEAVKGWTSREFYEAQKKRQEMLKDDEVDP